MSDGTGRPLREIQKEVLEWLTDNWDNSDIFALSLPCGVGKQLISRALQLKYEGAYITPNNMLIDQAVATYPTVNVLKGISHYKCKTFPDLTCQERKDISEHRCRGCKYTKARNKALANEPTFFNPMSYYYLTRAESFKTPPLFVLDEAHKLSSMLRASAS
jgi:superfamily II DNA or RNA helicase